MLKRIPWKFVLPALLIGALIVCGVIGMLSILGPRIGQVFTASTSGLDYDYAPEEPGSELQAGASGELSAVPFQTPRLIIYTVHMSLVVRDTGAAMTQIEELATDTGGYVTSSSTRQYEEGARASITLRVPAEELDQIMEQLRELALEVRHEEKSGEDVTEEYVDLNARLEILEAAEQELLELYQARQESGEVEDILEVYRQLTTFRQEIESLTGRIRYLEQAAAMSKITVELTPDVLAQPIEVGRWRPQGTARAAIEALISGLRFLVDAIIWLIILVLPLAGIIGALAYGLWRLIRRWRLRRKSSSPEKS